jgi:hypothetical protein
MTSLSDIQTGTIVKIDPKLKAGYIVRDGDGALVYFTFATVLEEVGLGTVRENQRVQYIQSTEPDPQDSSRTRQVATRIAILPAKPFR